MSKINGIQYAGTTGANGINSIIITFSQEDGEPDLEVISNNGGGEVHNTIKRAIEARCGFSFRIVGGSSELHLENDKIIFECCVVVDFAERRLAGNGKAEDILLAFARACADAAWRILNLLEHRGEMNLDLREITASA